MNELERSWYKMGNPQMYTDENFRRPGDRNSDVDG